MGRNLQFNESGYLLLVEDEPIVQINNKNLLKRRGYNLRQAYTLEEARAIIAEKPPRAIVLDIQLPDGSGLDFLQELRKTLDVPVLLLTALGTPDDIVRGLESGGDDYLTKPYELAVFISRVEALLRRASIVPSTLGIGPFVLNPTSGKAFLNGEDMMLSQKEYSLFQLLVQQPEVILSSEYLYERVWGQEMLDEGNALKVTKSKLTSKLAGSGYTITASRGEGYCLERE